MEFLSFIAKLLASVLATYIAGFLVVIPVFAWQLWRQSRSTSS